MHKADGTLTAYLVENRLESSPPGRALRRGELGPGVRQLTRRRTTLHYRLFKPRALRSRANAIRRSWRSTAAPACRRVLDNWSGTEFTQILTRAGYVVFQLDNRGSAIPRHGVSVTDARPAGRASRSRIRCGARTGSAHSPSWTAQRIGVWGWSYGGYMTLKLMFEAPDVFRAGVSGAPVTDWTPVRHPLHRALSRAAAGEAAGLCGELRAG